MKASTLSISKAGLYALVAMFFCAFAYADGRSELTTQTSRIERVAELIDSRLDLMPAVAAWKWRRNQPIYDAEREQRVIDSSVARAKALGIDESDARVLFEAMIAMAREVQAASIEQWRSSSLAPEKDRDLDTELRPEIDRIGSELLLALYLAAPDLRASKNKWAIDASLARLRRHPGIGTARLDSLAKALAQLRSETSASLDRIRRSGVLRIGTTGDYAPFSSDADTRLTGLDISLARELATHLQVSPIFIRTTWPELMNDLAEGRFDIAMSGISITAERAAQASFSVAYHFDGKTPLARCNNVRKFGSLAAIDRAGVRVITNVGGTNEKFVRVNIHKATVTVHPDNRSVFEELIAGRADVMFTDGVEVQLQARKHPELCGTMRAPLSRTGKAFMMPLGSDLKPAVDGWLGPQLADGTIARRLVSEIER